MQQKTEIILIVAQGENRAIGRENALLWHLPNDFKHFKQLTTGHSVLMGRKTFESIGKPLPNRRNIVITHQQDLHISGVEIAHSLEEGIALCNQEEQLFIIGGAHIYAQAMSLSDTLYVTTVHENFEADAFFPPISENEWECLEKTTHSSDEKHAHHYTFSTWKRKI